MTIMQIIVLSIVFLVNLVALLILYLREWQWHKQNEQEMKALDMLIAELDYYGVKTLDELEAAKARERDPFALPQKEKIDGDVDKPAEL